jgi:hypothetical protein
MIDRTVDSGILIRHEILEFEILAKYIPSITAHLWGNNSFLEVFYYF